MLARYYKHGALQLTEGTSMSAFQAECLGGTSVVNNAVCFGMPEPGAEVWRGQFGVVPADEAVKDEHINPTIKKLTQGAQNVHRPFEPCQVNISHDPQWHLCRVSDVEYRRVCV